MARITQAMLVRALGGDHVLVELLDKDGDGTADTDLVTDCLDYSEQEVNSAIALAVDVTDAQVTASKAVQRHQLALAVHRAYMVGTNGQGSPPIVDADRQEAMRWLDQVARRERGIGTTTRPATSQQVEQVTKEGETWTREDSYTPRQRFRGFW